MSDKKLTLESARELLSNIKDAQMLRNKHAGIVTQEDEDYFEDEEDVTQENREYFEDEDKEEVFNSPKDKRFAEQLNKALPGSDAEKFRDSIDELIEEQQVKDAFSKLICKTLHLT
ncbi:MAG TPA: hypothetical protein LFV66_03435 [Rickettsia endosymbiont of Bembidion lapponicum]|nr:hypothetical protein [Rickettsia endosymbiont of Bembidion lapponicum]